MPLQKKQIDFDWAYCQLLSLEHNAINEMLYELYPEVEANGEFINESNIASTHWQLIELKTIAAEIEGQIKDFLPDISSAEKTSILADFFMEYEQNRVESLASLLDEHIESGDVEVVEEYGEISFFHQLLPLFFSFDLKTKAGAFIRSAKSREIALKAFQKALRDSGKNLSGVKALYKQDAEQSGKVIFLAPFDKDFALAEKRFNEGKSEYLTPEDIEDLDLEKEKVSAQVDIEILKQSIIDRQFFKPGTIVETTEELARSLVDIGKARYVEDVEENNEVIEDEQESQTHETFGREGPWSGESVQPRNEFHLEGYQRQKSPVKHPSTWKYIQAWIIASILVAVVTRFSDMLMAEILITRSNFENSPYWILQPFISAVLWLVIMIFVYSLHTNLFISKVVPWIWGLGGLGIFVSVGTSMKAELPGVYSVSLILCFVAAIFFFGKYFESKHPDRY